MQTPRDIAWSPAAALFPLHGSRHAIRYGLRSLAVVVADGSRAQMAIRQHLATQMLTGTPPPNAIARSLGRDPGANVFDTHRRAVHRHSWYEQRGVRSDMEETGKLTAC